MNNKLKSIILLIVCGALIFGFSIAFVVGKDHNYSESERRVLEQFPKLSVETVMSGAFMDKLEGYSQDQFPLRGTMRTVKALSEYFIFGNVECNDFYLCDGHIAKIDYPQNNIMLDNAAQKLGNIIDKYISGKDCNVYFSFIPDKGYDLAGKKGVLSVDYNKFAKDMLGRLGDVNYIDIFGLLSAEDYYFTDPHWRQEKIIDVASKLAEGMGNTLSDEYTVNKLDRDFYGAYYGQAALPVSGEELYYLTNDTIDSCIVTDYDSGKPVPGQMYNMENAMGRDPYEMYLSGSKAILTIENPNADTEKELVVFRDSFGSSIVPLLCESYRKITLVDIRYIDSNFIGGFVDFGSCDDVLFLYSTMILNSSTSFK